MHFYQVGGVDRSCCISSHYKPIRLVIRLVATFVPLGLRFSLFARSVSSLLTQLKFRPLQLERVWYVSDETDYRVAALTRYDAKKTRD